MSERIPAWLRYAPDLSPPDDADYRRSCSNYPCDQKATVAVYTKRNHQNPHRPTLSGYQMLCDECHQDYQDDPDRHTDAQPDMTAELEKFQDGEIYEDSL